MLFIMQSYTDKANGECTHDLLERITKLLYNLSLNAQSQQEK